MSPHAHQPSSDTFPRDARAAEALELLQRTVQALALYPAEHPSVIVAAGRLAEALHALGQAELCAGVADGRFLLDDHPLGSDRLEPLATRLASLDVAAIVLRRDATPEQCLALAGLIGDARPGVPASSDLAEEIGRATAGRATIIPLSFDALHVHARTPGARAQDLDWAELIGSILHPPETTRGVDPAHAAAIDRAVGADGGVGADVAGRSIMGACDEAARMGEGAPDVRARIHDLVGSLQEGTRRRIIERCLSHEKPLWIGNVAQVFPPDEVVDAIERLQSSGAAFSWETMKLLQKISRLRTEHDADAEPRDLDFAEAVGSLLGQERDEREYLPEDYESQIDACVKDRIERPDLRAWTFDEIDLLFHKAEIGLELLHDADAGRDADADAVLEYLTEHLDRWIDAGRTALVLGAVRVAQRRAFADASAEAHAPAKRFLVAVDDRSRVDRLIRAAWTTDDARRDLVALLREAPHLLAHVPRILAGDTGADAPPRDGRAAAEVLLETPDAQLHPLIEALAATDRPALRAALDVLIALPGSRLASCLHPLLEHEDRAVRRMAYAALAGGGLAWRTEILRAALADSDREVQRLGVEHARRRSDEPALQALADMLAGALPGGATPWRDTCRAAARGLADAGPHGRSLACAALVRRTSTLGRVNGACAREIAAALTPHRAEPDVAGALARWSWSLVRVVGALTGARLPVYGARR